MEKKEEIRQLTQRRDESPLFCRSGWPVFREDEGLAPVVGQWTQTGFKDFDGTVPRTADPNWIRISHKSTKDSKSESISVYHWPSGPS